MGQRLAVQKRKSQ